MCDKDYERFLLSMREFNTIKPIGSLYEKNYIRFSLQSQESNSQLGIGFHGKLVEVMAYCLLPNHYHLILKQLVDNGISKFMHRLGLGYTNYFNFKYNRVGSLFQGKFKYSYLDTDEKIFEKLIYVNCNAAIHNLVNDPDRYKWSSYEDRLTKNWLLKDSKDIEEYKKFEQDVIIDIRENKKAQNDFF